MAAEEFFLQFLERAERLVAVQRRRVLQLEGRGLDLAQAQALLKLMEAVTEQFHVAWRLFRSRVQRLALPADAPSSGESGSPVARAGVPATPAAEPHILEAPMSCPHCGLMLHRAGADGALEYDMNEWAQRCRNPALQTPALCQLLRQKWATVH